MLLTTPVLNLLSPLTNIFLLIIYYGSVPVFMSMSMFILCIFCDVYLVTVCYDVVFDNDGYFSCGWLSGGYGEVVMGCFDYCVLVI